MLHLIVMGATGPKCPEDISEAIQNALYTRWPEHVHFVDTREAAYALLQKRYPRAVLAYAPGVFGEAVSGAKTSPLIRTTEPQLVITVAATKRGVVPELTPSDGVERVDSGPLDQWDGSGDPRAHLVGAIAALGVNLALAVDNEAALDVLSTVLEQPVLPGVLAL